ncbi:MAG: anthranilate synthase component I family protein [Verrucomicrobia bacterium]|nr:anthranilate synthase component I family protein [Verrucomicrobiota bacterium]MCF7709383.1 anthranilate synthase component I family protein [Verrucomicrobiota bacterium]
MRKFRATTKQVRTAHTVKPSANRVDPIIHSFNDFIEPEQVAESLPNLKHTFLLRSTAGGHKLGRYSILAAHPFMSLEFDGRTTSIHDTNGSRKIEGDIRDIVPRILSRFETPAEQSCPFPLGGCFGAWSYDLKNLLEPKLSPLRIPLAGIRLIHAFFYDSLIVFDHFLSNLYIVSTGLDSSAARSRTRAEIRLDYWKRILESATHTAANAEQPRTIGTTHMPGAADIRSNISKSEFIHKVNTIKQYIKHGHIYQVNLCRQLLAQMPCPPWELFKHLSRSAPAPFSAFADLGRIQLVSSSPELFLKIHGNHITTRPIKGTRPASSSVTRNAAFADELISSEKENAELLMITDLLRNDLGRVCELGSIRVPALASLERYSYVQHLVSTIEGSLRPGIRHHDALISCFPGGSITGAPKFRAMQIIDELESEPRGFYTGCLGYLGFNGVSQFNILIRTGIFADGMIRFPVGAGIVYDSSPEAEFEETICKANGFLRALNNHSIPHTTQQL